jgi:hypothetical protein
MRHLLLATTAFVLCSFPLYAAEWNTDGGTTVRLDTTLSLGANFRTQPRDKELVGIANGGLARSINGDDGNLNYSRGLTALAARATHEVEVKQGNYGLFSRFTYFMDPLNNNAQSTNFRDLSDKAVDQVGQDFDMLDAYVYGKTEIGDRRVDARLGRQVMNWGESTFIPGGINAINPVDLSALRIPGSELREALLPVEAVNLNTEVTDNLSVEGFYQLLWHETKLDAKGTYFSTSDIASPGSNSVYLGFGRSNVLDNPSFNGPSTGCLLGCRVPRGADDKPKDEGQFGVAARYYAAGLNDTEFGFYGMQYHSRLPLINARTGTSAAIATNYALSANYNLEYPEDIKLGGMSFNTSFMGISLAGEYALRLDQPLQIDDVEILQAALAAPAVATAGGSAASTAAAFSTNQIIRRMGGITTTNFATFFNRELKGYIRRSVSQSALTATKAFGPQFGADQWALVGEAGMSFIHDMPDKDELRLEVPGTYTGGNSTLAGTEGVTPRTAFADRFSWGYRVTARFDYLNAWGPVNLAPRISFQHDVNGSSPTPLNTFLEGRKAVSIGIGATYQQNWSADLQYTNFFGAGDQNVINDRDFVSVSIKYSF